MIQFVCFSSKAADVKFLAMFSIFVLHSAVHSALVSLEPPLCLIFDRIEIRMPSLNLIAVCSSKTCGMLRNILVLAAAIRWAQEVVANGRLQVTEMKFSQRFDKGGHNH